MLTMDPPWPSAIIRWMTAWDIWKVPTTLTETASANSSGGMFAK